MVDHLCTTYSFLKHFDTNFIYLYLYLYVVGYKAKGHKCSYALFEIFCSEDTADHGLPSHKVW